jgi:hypothetical protein
MIVGTITSAAMITNALSRATTASSFDGDGIADLQDSL